MSEEKKDQQQSPQEIIAKLGAKSNEEFNRFMWDHFDRLCKRPNSNGDGRE